MGKVRFQSYPCKIITRSCTYVNCEKDCLLYDVASRMILFWPPSGLCSQTYRLQLKTKFRLGVINRVSASSSVFVQKETRLLIRLTFWGENTLIFLGKPKFPSVNSKHLSLPIKNWTGNKEVFVELFSAKNVHAVPSQFSFLSLGLESSKNYQRIVMVLVGRPAPRFSRSLLSKSKNLLAKNNFDQKKSKT